MPKHCRKPGTMLRQICRWVGIAVAAAMLAACGAKKEKPAPRPPVPIRATVALQKTVPVQIRGIGNVEAYNTVSIKAQVSGVVAKVHFREGQDVGKGDLLFTIDPRPFEASLKQAEATLVKDRAQLRNAQEQVRRYGSLLKDGIVTPEQYDQLQTTAEALEATIAADRAAVDNARIQLGYCFIRSPIAGRTGNLAVDVGNLVKANDLPVLVTINQVSPIYATFTIPERDMVELRRHLKGGLKVEAFVTGDDTAGESGTVSFLDNAVDTATGTIKVKGTFANGRHRLWPGQFVTVVITLTNLPNAVVVPSQAVQTGQQGQFLFVVKPDQTVEMRPVTVGPTIGSETVIAAGVKPSDKVVTDGQVRLTPGAKVVEAGKPGPAAGNATQNPTVPAGQSQVPAR